MDLSVYFFFGVYNIFKFLDIGGKKGCYERCLID